MPKKKFTEEEARERKNERQRKYAKETGFAASKAYNAKTYKSYNVNFRRDDDSDIIDAIEDQRQLGINTSDVFRTFIRKAIKHK